jgi:hypothetical protein
VLEERVIIGWDTDVWFDRDDPSEYSWPDDEDERE